MVSATRPLLCTLPLPATISEPQIEPIPMQESRLP